MSTFISEIETMVRLLETTNHDLWLLKGWSNGRAFGLCILIFYSFHKKSRLFNVDTSVFITLLDKLMSKNQKMTYSQLHNNLIMSRALIYLKHKKWTVVEQVRYREKERTFQMKVLTVITFSFNMFVMIFRVEMYRRERITSSMKGWTREWIKEREKGLAKRREKTHRVLLPFPIERQCFSLTSGSIIHGSSVTTSSHLARTQTFLRSYLPWSERNNI